MKNVDPYFPKNYREARKNIDDAAQTANAAHNEIAFQGKQGPDGTPLAIDLVRLNPEAPKQIMVISGTHGVEGLCGSGCQVGLLEAKLQQSLPVKTGLILVHGLNPHGFSHQRRTNEDNVDLNRNFRSFGPDDTLPKNERYEELHPFLVPSDWRGKAKEAADAGMYAWMDKNGGERAVQAAVQGGQYAHQDGLFYGGREKVWSHRVFADFLQGIVTPALKHLIVVDVHTGLGPPDVGSLLDDGASSAERHRLCDWYGKVIPLSDKDSISAEISGSLGGMLHRTIRDDRVTYVAIEYGTLPMLQVLEALRGDNWLHEVAKGDKNLLDEQLAKVLTDTNRNAFYVDRPSWRSAIFERFAEVFGQACKGAAS